MRASVRRERCFAVGADVVWAVVSRPELLDRWFPGVVACHLADDVRTVTLATGASLEERIITNDPLQRRFQYRIAGGLFREHLATLDVLEAGEGRSLVIYACDADPAAMAIILGGAMAAALEELGRQLESGTGPLTDVVASAPVGAG